MKRLIATSAVFASAGLLFGAAACGLTVQKPAANTVTATPKTTPPTTPAPTHTQYVPVPVPQHPLPPPAPAPSTSYAQDVSNAGIVAPVSWIDQTGATLCADWAAGDTESWTDQNVLLPGGIYPEHLSTYDNITNSDVCPGQVVSP